LGVIFKGSKIFIECN